MASAAVTEPEYLFRFGRIDGGQQLHHHRSLHQTPPPQVVMPNDSFVFHVVGYLCSINSGEYHTLFQTPISISCHSFFLGHDHDFLQTLLSHQPHLHPFTLHSISQQIIPQLRRLFLLNPSHIPPRLLLRRRPRRFRFSLEIVLTIDDDGHNTDDNDDGHNINDNGEVVGMIPASDEAIRSLKTYKLPDCCPICMEKLHHDEGDNDNNEEEVEFTAMPCGHGFHHGCILEWLKKSHVCPICRYPLPTRTTTTTEVVVEEAYVL